MPQVNASWGTVPVDRVPDECPICHMGINAVSLLSKPIVESDNRRFQTVYKCPRERCGKVFVADFERLEQRLPVYTLTGLSPSTPVAPSIDPEVAAMSPRFDQVMAQAAAAEAYGLDQLAGMGYRKALEFLVKDYCIRKTPDKEGEIKAKLLRPVIAEYVDDSRVRAAAVRATYLGNDETRYERRWQNLDIVDLKKLIQMTVNFVDNDLMPEHYEAAIPT